MEQDNIRIEDFFKIIRKRIKSIAFVVILITVLSAILNFYVIPPLYKASTEVFIGKNDLQQEYNISDIQTYQKLLSTYAEVIKTDDLIQSALEKNNFDVDLDYVIQNISAEPKSDTQILEISYVDTDKNLTKDILEAVTNEFISYSRQLIPNESIKIIEKAKVPNFPVSPRKKANIAISFILGLILSCGVAIIIEMHDKSIKTKEDLEKIANIPVLGIIPLERKTRKEKKSDASCRKECSIC